MKIQISDCCKTKISAYAKKELSHFLLKYTNCVLTEEAGADRAVILETFPETREEPCYQLQTVWQEKVPVLYLRGSDDRQVLTAVYEALERMGIRFAMNGESLQGAFRIDACDRTEETITPFCRQRGIRQHINFPMDISSYHLEDAKAYIRNLARMKMNSITFHSYTGQWHSYIGKKGTVYAGNFFYGQRHRVPDYPVVKKQVDNESYYCIPEIERQLQDEKARSEFAMSWLGSLMETAKEAGLHITLSAELPGEESEDTLVEMIRGILKAYPMVDAVEWISPEGGGEGRAFPREELEAKLLSAFGPEALENGKLPFTVEKIPEALPGAMESLKRAVDLYKRKEEILEGFETKEIYVGLYVMCRDTLKILKYVMTRVLPEEVKFTFLPAHGSLAAAENIAYMDFTPEELQRTMIYSWLEFDGNMYLLQNGSKGIEKLVREAARKAEAPTIYGMCFNHWRTAENEMAASYMVQSTMKQMPEAEFYPWYAERNGIGESGDFALAMEKLGTVDCYNRDYLFNIGFCYLGCWLRFPGLGWIRDWKKESMENSIGQYEDIFHLLESCLEKNEHPEGIRILRFLMNRVTCSILQIRTILELQALCGWADDRKPEKLTEAQKEEVRVRCEKAMEFSRKYLDTHMAYLPDRGCQGTAVSYYATIPVYIDHILQYFVYGEKECRHRPESFDQPPAPDTAYL